jgi:hypothetical protein
MRGWGLCALLVLGLVGAAETSRAQSGRSADPTPQTHAPGQPLDEHNAEAPGRGEVPGTGLPSAAEPAPPPAPTGPSADGAPASTHAPALPDDPAQAPLPGIGWLLAAALGYGAYRVRRQGGAG